MLRNLKVSGIALIDQVDIDFSDGLCVLSGETGAGKTALLCALTLLIGERADSYMIRDGATQATVEGIFETADGTHQVKRRFGTDGKSRCWIDGERRNVADLAATIGPLVCLHGQHEHQTLLSPASHMTFFDEWMGSEATKALDAYHDAYAAWTAAQAHSRDLIAAAHATAHDRELAEFTIREITATDPREGEYEELEESLPLLQNAQELAQNVDEAHHLLYADEGSCDLLSSALTALGKASAIDGRLTELTDRLGDAQSELADIAGDVRTYRDSIEFDPGALESTLDRLGELDLLRKKYGPRMSDVFTRLEQATKTVTFADTSAAQMEEANRRLDGAFERLVETAAALSDIRHAHQDAFGDALTNAISSLGMGNAYLTLSIVDLPQSAWTADGPQSGELLYSPGSATAPRPLARIASGGELSRVMLALRGTLEHHGRDTVLVFDEIDAGIGGRTAVLIADRLEQLARTSQVIVVTHLAQIAVRASTQLLVTKRDDLPIPETSITSIEGERRVAEIARMLSGDVDETSLEHARLLLARKGEETA